ncbi:serine hydrolase domain-containing protein [Streptomyces sp. NPDC085479]|uniref:serine hydrolase domain-containing protein n=1 Tax=Streptomyces sp. NPDC085479 TaxID=3365726 RepID=UPI0037D1508D
MQQRQEHQQDQQDRASAFTAIVEALAEEHGVPGASVGILTGGQETFVHHGVTSLAHPRPVDDRTVFHVASVSKTFTATALLRLAERGDVDLAAPVRRYVPELVLADEEAAAGITVLQLLNHTAGFDWNLIDAEDEDGSLAAFVAKLDRLPLVAPPGARASYSQAGYNLAGRIVEKVTGQSFERAMAELVLEPLGLADTVFDADDVMLRPFVVGHVHDADGGLRAARPWKSHRAGARGDNPGGGIASTTADLLAWARFHLGDGDGLLRTDTLHGMRDETVELRGSTLGDGFGTGWFLRAVDGVRTIGHGGSGNGQYAELHLVPGHDFAVVTLANSEEGYLFNQAVVRAAFEHFLGLVEKDPEPVPYDEGKAREVAGRYEIDAMNLDIATDGVRLTLAVEIKPELRQSSDADMPPDIAPAAMGFLPGDGDEYVLTEGVLAGQRGFFTRDADGRVTGVDLGGRLFNRTTA